MLYGGNPDGIEGSTKSIATLANVVSQTLILLAAKFAAYRKLLLSTEAMVRPVKADCGGFLNLLAVRLAAAFQPEITPSNPLKRKAAVPPGIWNPLPPLNTIPVGNPLMLSAGEGMFTAGLAIEPSAS